MGDRLSALDRSFDVLVVGGGAFGSGVAREAALNGLAVALVERDDLAAGTSSRSSKMIHGGLRYLEHGEFRLVRQALGERTVLERLAPHLVKPCPFLVPLHHGGPRAPWKIRAGLFLYDLLARFPKDRTRSMLRPDRVADIEPHLRTDGLRAAGRYWDWLAYDARLVAEIATSASEAGAVVLTRADASAPVASEGGFDVPVTDRFDGSTVMVRTRTVVATVGPWSDTWRRRASEEAPPRSRLTSGVHLVVPRQTRQHAIVVNARSDGRVLFLLPFFGHTLIGTTDRDVDGDPGDARVEPRDIDYLLRETNGLLDTSLTADDVISSFCGVRSLAEDRHAAPSSTSREQQMFEEPDGVFHVVGGKLTTWRLIARELLERAAAHGGFSIDDGSRSRTTPITRDGFSMPTSLTDVAIPDLVSIARRTHALSVKDVLRRRTPIQLLASFDAEGVHRLAEAMGEAFGWDVERRALEASELLEQPGT